ncbi:MAG: GNAT family N-acetyltransferase [Lachnospiraceae bacterium]|jgi:GNAT superfamily N-acetyltransferase|nr:GNAT family N-acetyltransferase [Lachnospiraceae bacterium]
MKTQKKNQQQTNLVIRKAELSDLTLLMQWRMEVLHHVFRVPESEPLTALRNANRKYYREKLADGSHLACFAEENGETVGCGGLCLYQEMPSPDNPSGQCAYLMNVYTREQRRGKGVGSRIVGWLVAEAKKRGITKIYLETSEEGRRLYEKAGFEKMKDYLILGKKQAEVPEPREE